MLALTMFELDQILRNPSPKGVGRVLRAMRLGGVYVMANSEAGPSKVGVSVGLQRRRKMLSREVSGLKIHSVKWLPDSRLAYRVEARALLLMASLVAVKNEWAQASPDFAAAAVDEAIDALGLTAVALTEAQRRERAQRFVDVYGRNNILSS